MRRARDLVRVMDVRRWVHGVTAIMCIPVNNS